MGKRLSQEDIIRALLDTAFFKSAGATSLADIADKLGIKFDCDTTVGDIVKQLTALDIIS